jgi:nickel/cobalt transporter (NicO) family protein
MYLAAQRSLSDVIQVSLLFSIITIATMLGIVLLTTFGISFLPLCKLERYSHAMAGVIVFLSGVAILLGL